MDGRANANEKKSFITIEKKLDIERKNAKQERKKKAEKDKIEEQKMKSEMRIREAALEKPIEK